MAMTIEQKVMKKAKPFRAENLQYKKGLAIVIKSIEERAVEYSSDREYRVQLYFKSKAAIKRVGDALGNYKFDKKRELEKYERDVKYTSTTLSGEDFWRLSDEAGINIYGSLDVSYFNDYEGEHFGLNVDPSKPILKDYEDRYMGSTADSYSFSSFYKGIQELIVSGDYKYLR